MADFLRKPDASPARARCGVVVRGAQPLEKTSENYFMNFTRPPIFVPDEILSRAALHNHELDFSS